MCDKNINNIGLPLLSFPSNHIKLATEDEVLKIHDRLRRKWLVFTPEEYVRQCFVEWLITEFHYPVSLISNEVFIKLNETKKRCDTVVFRPDGSPLLIAEYKAPYININQEVFNQIVRYNMVLRANYLVVTNGMAVYCCKIDYEKNGYEFLNSIPDYKTLT